MVNIFGKFIHFCEIKCVSKTKSIAFCFYIHNNRGPTATLSSLSLANRRVRSPNPPGPIPPSLFRNKWNPDGFHLFLERAEGTESSGSVALTGLWKRSSHESLETG